MRTSHPIALAMTLAAALTAACGKGDSPTAPSTVTTTPPATTTTPPAAPAAISLAGTWTGALSVPGESRPIPVRSWTAAQSGASVSGPMVVDAGDEDVDTTLTGTVSGAQLTSATFRVPAQSGVSPGCSFSGIGTLAATTSSISGSLAMTFPAACVGPDNVSNTATATWTISLTK